MVDAAATGLDATAGIPAGTLLKTGGALVSYFLARIGDERARRAYATFLEQWTSIADLSDDEAQERVNKLLAEGDAAHDDLLHEMFRHMAFSRADAAWPYIAKRTARYMSLGSPADAFFRRCGWLFERCEGDDIRLLKMLVEETDQLSDRARELLSTRKGAYRGVYCKLTRPRGGASDAIQVTVTITDREDGFHPPERKVQGGRELADFMVLLEESRLGERGMEDRVTFDAESPHLDALLDLFGNPVERVSAGR